MENIYFFLFSHYFSIVFVLIGHINEKIEKKRNISQFWGIWTVPELTYLIDFYLNNDMTNFSIFFLLSAPVMFEMVLK